MKRILPNFLCVLILMASFSFLSFAVDQPATVTSVFPQPVPFYGVRDGQKVLDFYFVFYNANANKYSYCKTTAIASSSAEFTLDYGAYLEQIRCNEPFTFEHLEFDVLTGALNASNNGNSIVSGSGYSCQVTLGGTGYFNFAYYYIAPDNITNVRPDGRAKPNADPFVIWAQNFIPSHTYKSFVSEPVCDDLNRYFVFAGEEHKYLFALRYHIQEYSAILDSIVNNKFYWLRLMNYMVPKITKDDNSILLSLYCDPQLLSLIDAQSQSTVLHYGITIAKYDLDNGQFINSSNYNDLSIGVNEIPLNFDFGSVSDYDSAQFWGVYYNDDASQLHYNLLSCTWAIDPDFIYWQSQVIEFLVKIYNILNQTAEDVTIDTDMSAVDEGKSARDALKVTDNQGQTVNAADSVQDSFSEAASGMQSLSPAISSINSMISDIFDIHPYFLIIVFVALSLGLLVTILGKNVSD